MTKWVDARKCYLILYLWSLHGMQHTRPLCPSPSLRDCPSSCALSWHPQTITSPVVLLFCLQSFPPPGFPPMSQLFAWGGQSIGVSASVSALPMNIQSWFPLGLTGLISLLSKGLSRSFSSTRVWRHHFFDSLPSLWCSSHICKLLLQRPWPWPYGPL